MDSKWLDEEFRKDFVINFLISEESPAVLVQMRRWDDLDAVLDYVAKDAHCSLETQDPALYKKLCERVTYLRSTGWIRRS